MTNSVINASQSIIPHIGQHKDSKPAESLLAFVTDKSNELLLNKVFSNFSTSMQSLNAGTPGVHANTTKTLNGNIEYAISYLRDNQSPKILIVDIDEEEQVITSINALANVCEPGTRVLVIGSSDNVDLYRELKNMGIDDYLCKPLNQSLLLHALGRTTGKVQKTARVGNSKSIAIAGCSGGVGVSTIAANLARAFANHGAKTLVTDLNCYGGDIDLLLNANTNAGVGLTKLLNEHQTVDKLLIERSCLQIEPRLYLLKSLGQKYHFNSQNHQKLAQVLADEFNYLVWDLPAHLLIEPGIADTLFNADVQVIVCSPTLASLRQCKALLNQLGEQRYAQRTLLVLNLLHGNSEHSLSQTILAEHLGRNFDHVLPYAPKKVLKAAELGESLLSELHAVGRSLLALSNDILGVNLPTNKSLLTRLMPLRTWYKKASGKA
jgi:pilus assembly protein CpaE